MLIHRLLYCGFIIVACSSVLSLSAQTLRDSTTHLSECVVTGTMVPRTLKSIPIMTQLITSQDIARLNPRSATDILQMAIPGIEVSRHGAQTRLKIQGMSAEHVLFMLDGEPINSEGNGSVDLNRIDIASIERIEIVRGSASALYGSSAMGGVINFITRNVRKPLAGHLSVDYGTEGAWRTHGLVGFRLGAFSSQSTVNYNRQAPYTLLADSDTPFLLRGEQTWLLGEKLRFQSKDRVWDISANLSGSRRILAWDEKIKYLYDSYDLGGRIHYAPHLRHSAFLSYMTSGYERQQYFFTARENKYLQLFDLATHRLRGQYNWGAEGQDALLVNVGFDALWEDVGGERIQNEGQRYSSSTLALYGQAEWRALPYLSASLGFREDIHSNYGLHFSPRATLLFKQNRWRLRLSYSEGFRSPSTKELHMDWDHRGIFRLQGSPDLRPERSRMISLAPEFQLAKDINLTLLSSYNRISNRIYNREENGGLVRRFRNAESISEIWQGQISLRWQLSKALNFNADYVYVRDRVDVYSKSKVKLPASTVRPHSITSSLSCTYPWRHALLSMDVSFRWASAISTAVFSEALADYEVQDYEPYSILRVGGSLRNRGLKATLGIDNLLNYKARQLNISSSFSPGRTLFASLSLSF